jgi:S-DNA-T family DNA segregation ATPase FtsK/SpoIIIE
MTAQPLQPEFQQERVKVSLRIVALVWFGRTLARLVVIVVRSPAKMIVLLPLAAGWYLGQIAAWMVISFALLCFVLGAAWAMQFPASFQRNVSGRARGTARNLLIYRWRWRRALRRCGVILTATATPLLLRTSSTKVFDRLLVRMATGQRLEDYAEASDRLAQTFGALGCRASAVRGRPQWLELLFLTSDPLVDEVPPFPPDPEALSRGLPVARREDGRQWRLRLLGSHLLIAGATAAGKSAVMWAIVHALVPAIEDGLVKLWVIDPKGGMEFAGARRWFDRFAHGSRPTQFAEVLEEAVRVMQRRQAAMFGVAQSLKPSTENPLLVVFIDELAALTSYSTNQNARRRIKAALELLMSQGRTVGVTVMGAVQDPRKDTVPMRGLFTTRIALRLTEASEVALVLGPGARERGAYCDQIPRSLPGVGFVEVDGDPMPSRVRFAHVTDEMLGPRRPGTLSAEPTEDVLVELPGFA